jgi:hypothetical protein
MRWSRIALLALAASLAVAIAVMARNPLRHSDTTVRAWLLEEMPLGSSSERVRTFAKARGWFDPFRQRGDGACYGPYIRGELGRYWSGAAHVYVSAIWEFDSSNRLAGVRIRKHTKRP